jgi:hypothetical protein
MFENYVSASRLFDFWFVLILMGFVSLVMIIQLGYNGDLNPDPDQIESMTEKSKTILESKKKGMYEASYNMAYISLIVGIFMSLILFNQRNVKNSSYRSYAISWIVLSISSVALVMQVKPSSLEIQ